MLQSALCKLITFRRLNYISVPMKTYDMSWNVTPLRYDIRLDHCTNSLSGQWPVAGQAAVFPECCCSPGDGNQKDWSHYTCDAKAPLASSSAETEV